MATIPFPRLVGTSPGPPHEAAAGISAAGRQEVLKAVRRPASAVPSITGLRISPSGDHATLVDISESGLLAECGAALKVGQQVQVVFEGTFLPSSVRARVARSCVAAMTSAGCRYHLGIAFETPIAFDDEPSSKRPAGDGPAPVVLDGATQPSPVFNRW